MITVTSALFFYISYYDSSTFYHNEVNSPLLNLLRYNPLFNKCRLFVPQFWHSSLSESLDCQPPLILFPFHWHRSHSSQNQLSSLSIDSLTSFPTDLLFFSLVVVEVSAAAVQPLEPVLISSNHFQLILQPTRLSAISLWFCSHLSNPIRRN